MTPEKQRQKLAGQSSIAQKVFQFVPINELWTPLQIAQVMQRDTRSRVDMHILRGCLSALADAGLIRATNGGAFRRSSVSQPTDTAPIKESTLTAAPQATSKEEKSVSAIELLSGIAKKMRAMADEIETVALTIEDERAKDADKIQKAKQLSAMLKEFA